MSHSKMVVVLVMHGGIPKDFPKAELKRFRQLRLKGAGGDQLAGESAELLEAKMRRWPQSEENDPYYCGSMQLRNALQEDMQVPVILAFNEFCAPTIEEAIVQGVHEYRPQSVMVITPMLTRGGRHAETDIPEAIERAKIKIDDKSITIKYVWPIDTSDTASFLAAQIRACVSTNP